MPYTHVSEKYILSDRYHIWTAVLKSDFIWEMNSNETGL